MEKPRTELQKGSATDIPQRMLVANFHVEHISVHYYNNVRSRTEAQRIARRLKTIGLSTVEMHTTAQDAASPLVRYFWQEDAPAAASLAQLLGRKSAVWHPEDCTAYRHKPSQGTLQIWPVTATANPRSPAKAKSPPQAVKAER
jgi:hypothetical protein